MMLRLGRQRRSEFLRQNSGEPADVPQRRPQVMRNRVSERFEFLVRGLQLGCAFEHPSFQIVVKFADLFRRPPALRDIEKSDDRAGCFLAVKRGMAPALHREAGTVFSPKQFAVRVEAAVRSCGLKQWGTLSIKWNTIRPRVMHHCMQ